MFGSMKAVNGNHGAVGGGELPPVPLTKEEVSYVKSCVDVLYTLCEIYYLEMDGCRRSGTYDHWVNLATQSGNPMKFVKWKIAAFYAVHVSSSEPQEIPPCPFKDVSMDNPAVLLGGRAYKYILMMKEKFPKRFESFLTSVLYSKKGMPRPGKLLLRKGEKDTFKSLTTLPQYKESVVDWAASEGTIESMLDISTMTAQIKRTVNELFKDKVYTRDDRIRPFFPSTSSNYNNSRSKGGAVGDILMHPELLVDLRGPEDLVSIKMEGCVGVGEANQDSMLYDNNIVGTSPTVDISALNSKFEKLYNNIINYAMTEEPIAKPLGLSEALKVRVISKGPPLTYTALKPLQKFMWKTIVQNPIFRLIGEPVTAENLQMSIGSKLKPGYKFLSVDYSDATNSMFSWTSDAAVDEISDCLKLTVLERILFRRAMTEHIIEDSETGEQLPQRNGQLMGSVVSFPILCIVNAAICRWTMELVSGVKIPLRDLNLLINGDDAVFKTNDIGKHTWEVIGSFCGLKPSVGKVYFSSHFLNINSTTYNFYPEGFYSYYASTKVVYNKKQYIRRFGVDHVSGGQYFDSFSTITIYDRPRRVMHYELVTYVNLGLMFGLTRSASDKSIEAPGQMTLGACARMLVESCPTDVQEQVLAKFIHYNEESLKQFSLPWFLPESFYGLGLPSIGKFKPERFDVQCAQYIRQQEIKVRTARPTTPWKVWEYAQKRFPQLTAGMKLSVSSDLMGNGFVSKQTVMGYLCVESIFRVGLDQIFSPKGDVSLKDTSSEFNFYRDQSRRWNKVRNVVSLQLNKGNPDWGLPIPRAIPDTDKENVFLDITQKVCVYDVAVLIV